MIPTLQLALLSERYAVCRMAADEPIPSWACGGELVSITRTREELSVICRETAVPDGVRTERGWRCFQVEGPLPFESTGIAAAITSPLAAADISVFVIATFDTDYVLVKASTVDRALQAWREAGHSVSA